MWLLLTADENALPNLPSRTRRDLPRASNQADLFELVTWPWSRADRDGVGAELAFQQLEQGLLVGGGGSGGHRYASVLLSAGI